MATEKGVWDLQDVRDKQLQSLWSYDAVDPAQLWMWGSGHYGALGQNDMTGSTSQRIYRSSPV